MAPFLFGGISFPTSGLERLGPVCEVMDHRSVLTSNARKSTCLPHLSMAKDAQLPTQNLATHSMRQPPIHVPIPRL